MKPDFFSMMRAALAALILAPALVCAHGESEPGPNGGGLRMPGAFHVEAVPDEDSIHIYLLDMQFKNPQVDDSSVVATLRQQGRERPLDCRVEGGDQMFTCPLRSMRSRIVVTWL